MSNNNMKIVPIAVKERKHLGAKPYITGSCIDSFAGSKVKEHNGLMRIEMVDYNSKIIKYYFDGTILTVDLKK